MVCDKIIPSTKLSCSPDMPVKGVEIHKQKRMEKIEKKIIIFNSDLKWKNQPVNIG